MIIDGFKNQILEPTPDKDQALTWKAIVDQFQAGLGGHRFLTTASEPPDDLRPYQQSLFRSCQDGQRDRGSF
jgi:hypothetical protein